MIQGQDVHHVMYIMTVDFIAKKNYKGKTDIGDKLCAGNNKVKNIILIMSKLIIRLINFKYCLVVSCCDAHGLYSQFPK